MSRFLYWLTFGVLAALLLARPLYSQAIPVSGHMGDASEGAPPGMSLKFELYNCGANTPKIVGSFSIVKQNFTLTPDTTGLLTGTVIPNDIISCGGAVSTTRYNVTTLLDGIPQAPAACYFVQQSLGTFNLDTATPCTSISPPQPPTPPTDGTFDNLMVSGVLSGGSAVFGSTVHVHELLLDFSPISCSTNAFMVGYNADLTVRCSTLSYSQLAGSVPIWNQDTTGNAASATLAATATHVPYTGLTGSVPIWNQSTTGNAATATNVPYSGLTGGVPTWNQSTTGNAATATALAALPSQCSGGTPYSSGIVANGNANCLAGGTVTHTAGALTATHIMTGNGAADATVDSVATLDGSGNAKFASVSSTGTGAAFATQSSTNTDLTGELNFAATTTATYSWAPPAGITYTIHPEVVLTPQATTATSGQPYVTYTGVTSFTINFPSAFTGNVSYISIGRN
jgi:hypothetical protein